MLKGFDVSHWNKKDTIDKYSDHDFVIMKATEGKTFVDPDLNKHYEKAKWYGLLRGYYHFARPDLGNSAEDEAKNYLLNVPEREGALHALDVEGMAVMMDNIDTWSLRWLNYVEAHTGNKPLLYTSQSNLNKFKKVAENGNGLWVARYNVFLGSIKPWKIWAIWQHTSTPLDKNKFNGNIHQFLKYQGKEI